MVNFFLEKMKFVFEKVSSYTEKNHLIAILFAGQKIQKIATNCEDDSCHCLKYLEQIDFLVENMNERRTLNEEEKAFFKICLKKIENRFYYLIKFWENMI